MAQRQRSGSGRGSQGGASGADAEQNAKYRILSDAQLDKYAARMNEVGDIAVWMVSSSKYGNGVNQLRNGNTSTYWQSDGVLPHSIRVEFPRLVPVHSVAVCLSYMNDESYTPAKLSIRAGTHENDMAEVAVMNALQPNGWLLATLREDDDCGDGSSGAAASSGGAAAVAADACVYCTYLVITITENHQQGRDTHVRGVKLFSYPPALQFQQAVFTQHLALR